MARPLEVAALKPHLVSDGVAGIPTRTLMAVFVVVMALAFVLEFGLRVVGLLGSGLQGDILLLTLLIGTEVPLWFCQVLLWDRGERTFGAWEARLIRTVETLERLGFVVEFLEPAITALKSVDLKLTAQEREALHAVQFATAQTYIMGLRITLRTSDPKTVGEVVASYREAQKAWHAESRGDGTH